MSKKIAKNQNIWEHRVVFSDGLTVGIHNPIPYLPVDEPDSLEKLKKLEKDWRKAESLHLHEREKDRGDFLRFYSKHTLRLNGDSPFGVLIGPDRDSGQWNLGCNYAYFALFGNKPKEEVFLKVERFGTAWKPKDGWDGTWSGKKYAENGQRMRPLSEVFPHLDFSADRDFGKR